MFLQMYEMLKRMGRGSSERVAILKGANNNLGDLNVKLQGEGSKTSVSVKLKQVC